MCISLVNVVVKHFPFDVGRDEFFFFDISKKYLQFGKISKACNQDVNWLHGNSFAHLAQVTGFRYIRMIFRTVVVSKKNVPSPEKT